MMREQQLEQTAAAPRLRQQPFHTIHFVPAPQTHNKKLASGDTRQRLSRRGRDCYRIASSASRSPEITPLHSPIEPRDTSAWSVCAAPSSSPRSMNPIRRGLRPLLLAEPRPLAVARTCRGESLGGQAKHPSLEDASPRTNLPCHHQRRSLAHWAVGRSLQTILVISPALCKDLVDTLPSDIRVRDMPLYATALLVQPWPLYH